MEHLLNIIAQRNDEIIYQIDKLTFLLRLLLILNTINILIQIF
ncbi:hypothetical protein [Helcococcus kunzii]|nr:hypothetical protein [Helcococcus kunzii]